MIKNEKNSFLVISLKQQFETTWKIVYLKYVIFAFLLLFILNPCNDGNVHTYATT